MPISNVDPNFMRNQQLFLDLRSKQIVAETKGNPLNYVLYKRRFFPLTEAMCFVQFKNTLYAVIKVDPVNITNTNLHLKKVGEVFRNKKGENDLSDMPEDNTETVYSVYQKGLSHHLLVETSESKSILYPMLKVRTGI